jgi:transcription initiation factor IIF auxiliary subunit
MRKQHQKNLKIILSLEQDELANWLAQLPDDEIEYVEWLLEEVEIALDNMIMKQTDMVEAKEIIKKYTLPKVE